MNDEQTSDDHIRPKTALEIAGIIAAFARSLSDDEMLLCDALTLAYQSVSADRLALLRSRR